MNKQKAIETVQRMFEEFSTEVFNNGFDEMDQAQIELMLSNDFLNEVSINGLEMMMQLIERNSYAKINRKSKKTKQEIIKTINEYYSS